MIKTLEYYNEDALNFVTSTKNVDFHTIQLRFIRKLSQGAAILDFGCGSGRDTKYFLSQGYQVDALDGSEEMCRLAGEYTGISVRQMLFQELSAQNIYDGIWACSSILHLPYHELKEVFLKMACALKENGIVYTSFKYGIFEGERNGRYFTDMTEEKMEKLLQEVSVFHTEELWISGDVRTGREDEKWLNIILRKN
jgi:SAM-dependent methyltransferase